MHQADIADRDVVIFSFCRVLHAIPVIEYLHRADTADGDVVPVPADRQVARSALVLANCYLDIFEYDPVESF